MSSTNPRQRFRAVCKFGIILNPKRFGKLQFHQYHFIGESAIDPPDGSCLHESASFVNPGIDAQPLLYLLLFCILPGVTFHAIQEIIERRDGIEALDGNHVMKKARRWHHVKPHPGWLVDCSPLCLLSNLYCR